MKRYIKTALSLTAIFFIMQKIIVQKATEGPQPQVKERKEQIKVKRKHHTGPRPLNTKPIQATEDLETPA